MGGLDKYIQKFRNIDLCTMQMDQITEDDFPYFMDFFSKHSRKLVEIDLPYRTGEHEIQLLGSEILAELLENSKKSLIKISNSEMSYFNKNSIFPKLEELRINFVAGDTKDSLVHFITQMKQNASSLKTIQFSNSNLEGKECDEVYEVLETRYKEHFISAWDVGSLDSAPSRFLIDDFLIARTIFPDGGLERETSRILSTKYIHSVEYMSLEF